jgi:hypothetical protein
VSTAIGDRILDWAEFQFRGANGQRIPSEVFLILMMFVILGAQTPCCIFGRIPTVAKLAFPASLSLPLEMCFRTIQSRELARYRTDV